MGLVDGRCELAPGDYERVKSPRFVSVSDGGTAAVDADGRIWHHVTITPGIGEAYAAWLHEDIPCFVVRKKP